MALQRLRVDDFFEQQAKTTDAGNRVVSRLNPANGINAPGFGQFVTPINDCAREAVINTNDFITKCINRRRIVIHGLRVKSGNRFMFPNSNAKCPNRPSQNEYRERAVQVRNAPVFAPVSTALRRGELLRRGKECGVRPNLISVIAKLRAPSRRDKLPLRHSECGVRPIRPFMDGGY